MMIREDGGWEKAEGFTGAFSAIVTVARMMVIQQLFLKREEQLAELYKQGEVDRETAYST